MQIAVGVTSDEGEVIEEGVVLVLHLRAVGICVITTPVKRLMVEFTITSATYSHANDSSCNGR